MKNKYYIGKDGKLFLGNKILNSNNDKEIYKPNNQRNIDEGLLKIFINIFYYEKYLSENKEKAFDNHEQYYLINPQWLKNYKNYYNYDDLYNSLKAFKTNDSINYKNLKKFYKSITNELINKNINFEARELTKNLLDIRQINCSIRNKYNIPYIYEGIIFPSTIMEKIKKCHKKISKDLVPKGLFYFKNKNIFFINNNEKKITIGNLNEDNIFISKNIFVFNSIDKLEIWEINIVSDLFLINKFIQESLPIEKINNYRIFN